MPRATRIPRFALMACLSLGLLCGVSAAEPPEAERSDATLRPSRLQVPPTRIPSIVDEPQARPKALWTPADPRWLAEDAEPGAPRAGMPADGLDERFDPLDPYDPFYADEFRYDDLGRYGRFYMPHGYYYGQDPFGVHQSLQRAYRHGRYDERFYGARVRGARETRERTKRLLTRHEQAVREGVDFLRAGDYPRAIAALTLAAKLHQGDPACRVHLMQARLALGQYAEAGAALRRALELQPKLIYLDLALDSYFLRPGTLATLSDGVRTHVSTVPAPVDVHFLHAFLEYQRGELPRANKTLRHLLSVRPDDDIVRDLLDLTHPGPAVARGREPEIKIIVEQDEPR